MDWTKQGGSMAEHYASFLVPAMFAPCAEILLDAAGPQPGDDVLDVACGTGAVSRAAAGRVGESGSVVGVDMGPPMLAVARGLGPADIDFREGNAQALPVQEEAFDVAVCQHGFQFFPDRPAALAEMVRALRPGGTVAIACWARFEDSPMFVALARAFSEHVGAEEDAAMRTGFAISPDDLDALLADLEDVAVDVVQVPAAFAGPPAQAAEGALLANPLAAVLAELPIETQRAMIDQLAAEIAPYDDGAGYLRPPMFTTIATARRPS